MSRRPPLENNNVFQPPLVVVMVARMRRKGMTLPEVAAIVLDDDTDAGRKKMERTINKWKLQYPGVFEERGKLVNS